MDAILKGDKDASNVLLLNYHNTLNSTHGLSYRYLTALTERRRGYDTKARIKLWADLEYMNYGEEIELIMIISSYVWIVFNPTLEPFPICVLY